MDELTRVTIVAAIHQAGHLAAGAEYLADDKAVSWAIELQEEAAKQLLEKHQKEQAELPPPPPAPERQRNPNEICDCDLSLPVHVFAYHFGDQLKG